MAVTLVGEVVNSADATTGFSAGNISGDDDNVEGTGALGLKCSNATCTLDTTSLGAGAPYDFSVGGPEEGYHIVGWFNTKTPIAATGGLRFFCGASGTNYGHWYVDPTVFYKGGFITKVVDTARDFDVVNGTFAATSNPSQLTAIANMGTVFNTTTSIMGSFNNIQMDQLTIGLGVRADAGTVGTPNTFETVRAQDEDTSFWGWWSSTQGAIIGKGKLYIGPATGTASSVFDDSAFSVIFADELVAVGFYDINIRGDNTDVTWELGSISSANPANARWSLTIDGTISSFADTNSVISGADVITLSAVATLTGTTLIDCTQMVQNGATLDGVTVLNANTADGVAFLESDNPALISDSEFNFSDGHAIEITTPGTYSFSGNTFIGYGADATNDAAIYNNSGGAVTLNIVGGGGTPTIRNGAGATTTVNNATTYTVTGLDNDSLVTFVRTSDDTVLSQGNPTLGSYTYSYNYVSDVAVDILIADLDKRFVEFSDTLIASNKSVPITQRADVVYSNP